MRRGRLQRCFVDLRVILCIMSIWLICVLGIVIDMNVVQQSAFFSVGPSDTLMFFHSHINNCTRYNMLVCLIVFHTIITDFISDALNPNLLNVVQNRSQKYIPHSKAMYYTITNVWATYCSVSGLISIYIALSQCDLMLIRLLADITANMCTMHLYMQGKTYDVQLYNKSLPQADAAGDVDLDTDLQNQRRSRINEDSEAEINEDSSQIPPSLWQGHYEAKDVLLTSLNASHV